MAVKIFLTGATGYIGGDALHRIYQAHPDYEYTLLVRNKQRAEPIKSKYPNVNIVYGGLDDAEIVEKAASEADIVVHTADSSDNVPGATAIAKGLKAGHSAEKPGYWIHVSGTSILTWYDAENERFGEPPLDDQKYYDIQGIDRITSIPDAADHRNVDKIVQGSASDTVKLAILCPPTIYGTGAGQVKTRSIQIPDLAKATLEKGFAPIVGAGKTEWDNIHVEDLGQLFVDLVDATHDSSKNKNDEIFGIHGYYFVANAVHKWADVATWIAEEASRQGYLPEPLTKVVSQKEVMMLDAVAAPSYGCNSKGVPERASKYLGWKAKGVSMKDTIAEAVTREAKDQGLTPKEK